MAHRLLPLFPFESECETKAPVLVECQFQHSTNQGNIRYQQFHAPTPPPSITSGPALLATVPYFFLAAVISCTSFFSTKRFRRVILAATGPLTTNRASAFPVIFSSHDST